MKAKSIILAVLITLSTLFFGITNSAKAETSIIKSGNIQSVLQPRVETVVINGVIWIIVYDADENIVQASAVGHAG
jgi:hypothetical protein